MPANAFLQRVMERGAPLSRAEAAEVMRQIFSGGLSELELAALTGGLAARGETAAELAGFVDTMRASATPIPLTDAERAALVDTCGTGGDASDTFNISTASALVAAAAGATVAKHGNRAITSKSGSADVLEALGIPIAHSPDEAAMALRTHRFAYLHAPMLQPAMKAALPVRRALGVRTVFNVLGPLANPAGAQAQIMGVYAAHLVPLVAEAMQMLGVRHAFVVHGETDSTGLDELSISGPSHLAEVHDGAITVARLVPEDLGLTSAPLESLRGGDAATNAQILRAIFSGEPGPCREIVLLNASAALVAAGLAERPAGPNGLKPALRAGIALAARAIDSGAVTKLVVSLAE